MTRKLKNKAALSTYQGLYDENELVQETLQEGNADLMFHLQFFKKKLSESIKNQEKKFDNIFFEKVEEDSSLPVSADEMVEKVHKNKGNTTDPKWAKTLYRKIVMLTHPDKTAVIPMEKIRDKLNKQYLVTIDALKAGTYENIAMIANQLELAVPNQAIDEHVLPKSVTLKKKIVAAKAQLGYQWYHIKEEEKKDALKKYLHNLGFVFTEEELEDAIAHGRKRIKRRPGQRPVNYIRRRMRLK